MYKAYTYIQYVLRYVCACMHCVDLWGSLKCHCEDIFRMIEFHPVILTQVTMLLFYYCTIEQFYLDRHHLLRPHESLSHLELHSAG